MTVEEVLLHLDAVVAEAKELGECRRCRYSPELNARRGATPVSAKLSGRSADEAIVGESLLGVPVVLIHLEA